MTTVLHTLSRLFHRSHIRWMLSPSPVLHTRKLRLNFSNLRKVLVLVSQGCKRTKNEVTLSSRNLFFHSSGGWKSKIKVLAELCSPLRADSVPCLSLSFWWLPTTRGVPWIVGSSLQHGVLSVSLVFLFIRTTVIGLGPTQMEYDLNLITSIFK